MASRAKPLSEAQIKKFIDDLENSDLSELDEGKNLLDYFSLF